MTKGLIAADPRVLPLGTRVRLEAGAYSGEYVVADTGGAVRGKKLIFGHRIHARRCALDGER
mgnify:CR=1 FL=1